MNTRSTLFQDERNKNLFLLFAILIHNLIYPMSTASGIQPIIFYLIFSSMFVFAVYFLSDDPTYRLIITLAGIIVFIAGMLNVNASSDLTLATLYISVFIYHAMMTLVLVQYVFRSQQVLFEVILAATSLYLVFGSMCTTVYGLIDLLEPGSFAVASGAVLDWQHLLYFSYVTLTTVGYGDITPVKFYAQSFSAFEAVLGVLYTVILLARLVSLYESENRVQSEMSA